MYKVQVKCYLGKIDKYAQHVYQVTQSTRCFTLVGNVLFCSKYAITNVFLSGRVDPDTGPPDMYFYCQK